MMASGTETAPALSVAGIALAYAERPVLVDVDLAVAAGEVVGLLGRNGAGKTSLLRIVAGGLAPDRGRVTFAGHDASTLTRRARARAVATVPQETHIPFPFSAGEVVLMGRTPHQPLIGFESQIDLERAQDALARAGVAALQDRPVTELSGGERQLVMFARALAQAPQVLLLDEPTAFLDLKHRIDVLGVVRDFARAGGAALVVSHDLALAARVCDRVVVLADGGVLAEGRPADVLTPALIRTAFGIEADVITAPDGRPLVIPHIDAGGGVSEP
jgi:iron complex transport system ATP-binding protein